MIEFLKKNKIKYTVSAEGMVYVNDNLFIKKNENITFDKLAEVHGSVYVRENSTFTAPALAKSGFVYVSENATLTAPALAKSGSVYVRENATFTAPSLAKSGSVYVSENATFTAPSLAKSGYVYVRENATFTAPALVEVSCSVYVRENATFTAPALAEVSGYVYVHENATLTAPALVTIGEVGYVSEWFGYKVEVFDGIGCVSVSEKQRDGVDIRYCRSASFKDGELVGNPYFVVSQNGFNAHGDTIESALSDLLFKQADRDVSVYKHMPIDTVKSPQEWAAIYRVITGACSLGTAYFMKEKGELKDIYTLAEIIEETLGAYGHERFVEVVK